MKQAYQPVVFGLFIGVFILGIFFVDRNTIGNFVWKHYKWDTIALTLDSNNEELAMSVGNYYFNVDGGGGYDLNKARKAFERALLINPDVYWAHYQLARIHFINGGNYLALLEINREIRLHPENSTPYYVRGLILGYRDRLGDLEQAEEDFERFTKGSPQNWAGYNDLAWIQIRQEKFAEAKKTVLKAFEILPFEKERNVWLWTSLGTAHLNMREYNKAKENFLLSQEISKGFTAEYFWSAYPGNNQQNANEAFKQFLASLHFNLGIVYENLGETIKSIGSYEAYLSLLPQGPFPQKNEVQEKILTLEAQL